jgi:hypothetical protein
VSFILAEEIASWSDYDGVGAPIATRNLLPKNAQKPLYTIASKVGFACIITNSNPEEVEKTLSDEVLNSGLVLIGEHGSVAKFDPRAGYEPHPDLTVDRSVLPELAKRAKEILDEYGMPWTEDGADLHRGQRVIKVEQKLASFALVRALSGFNENARQSFDYMESVIKEVMSKLSEPKEFDMTRGGWALNPGADAQEFAQSGFIKQKGVQWAMDRCGLENKTHIMYEDGNESLLKWFHQTHNAFNIAVGDGLPHPDEAPHIARKLEGIPDYWLMQQMIADRIEREGGICLDELRGGRDILPSVRPKVLALG